MTAVKNQYLQGTTYKLPLCKKIERGNLQVRAEIIVSLLFGLLLPWFYFLVVEIVPMDIYKNDVLIRKAAYKSELMLFVDYHCWLNASVLYLKSFIACSLCTFTICYSHSFIARKLNSNL